MLIKPKPNTSSNLQTALSFVKRNVLDRNIKTIRYSCLIAAALGASTQTSITQADNLDNFLGGMYSNTTDAGYFQTQQRGVISGGSIVARVPIKPINIAQFDPPRVSAGCGGVNLFGASFSFINAQELTQLLRTVAQNALGLLFQLGLNAISQPLSSLLTSWSKKLQDMNAALKNSCEAARKLFQIDYSGAGLSSAWESMKGVISSSTGENKDFFGGFKERFQKGWQELRGTDKAQTTADKAAQKIDSSGNVTWRALNASGSYKSIVAPSGGSEEEAKYLLMNIIGTEIFPTTKDQGNCEGGQGNCEPKPQTYYPTITFNDLISPDNNKDSMFVCQDGDNTIAEDGCAKELKPTSLRSMFKGTAYIVNKAFYGIESSSLTLDPNTISEQIAGQKGLVGKSGLAGAQLTQDELRMLNAMPHTLVRYMNALRNEPAQMAQIAEHIREYVIKDMAFTLAISLAEAADSTFNGPNVKAKPPAKFTENMQKFRADAYANALKPNEKMQYNNELQRYVTFVANSQYHPTFTVRR